MQRLLCVSNGKKLLRQIAAANFCLHIWLPSLPPCMGNSTHKYRIAIWRKYFRAKYYRDD